MTKDITVRLARHFKEDFKKARYQAACMYNLFSNPHVKSTDENRFNRKLLLFDICKELYIECRLTLGLNKNEPLPNIKSTDK